MTEEELVKEFLTIYKLDQWELFSEKPDIVRKFIKFLINKIITKNQ